MMHKKRYSLPDGPEAGVKKMIRLIVLIIGLTILGVLAFEAVLGLPPTGIEALAIGTIVVIFLWLKDNA